IPLSLSSAGSGADTELTGRHPAPCNERYIALLFSPSPEGLSCGQKKARNNVQANMIKSFKKQ
ncbi:TPA: hypothetical protein ACHT4V_005245, partial [Escherichia coli]